MKATGIVRRIDDLGRVVIPKEIRRTLKIRESEPLEIFTAKTCGKLFCICDQEQVVAAAGPENKKYQGKSLSKAMEQRLFDRDFIPENNAYYPVTDDDAHTDQALVPVTRDGDPVGAVCFLGMKRTDPISEADAKVAEMIARYLTFTMNN